ncbi:flagellar protein FlgN [Cupriavidus basilensis]|uniref:Flagellar protein FlgN n=1 Tax=Cupriavidus basilensis TaxID=68895 RepID=A0ABT6AP05_9BURK|nr:flagellar protein FlgN [Cupriavidus basilensis]MDF3834355.1 flagellar protein FlgN [Cupriavidus basilensis]
MSQPLIQNLNRETELAKEFAAVLGEERAMIKAGNYEALASLLERKVELAGLLGALTRTREAQMGALGIRLGAGGQLFGREIDPVLESAWRKLLSAVRLASDANAVNTAVVDAHLEFTKEAIQVLRQRGDSGPLYGRDGLTRTGPQGVSLASG